MYFLFFYFLGRLPGNAQFHPSRHRAIRGFRPDYRQGQPPLHSGSTTIPIAMYGALAKYIRNRTLSAKAIRNTLPFQFTPQL